MRWDKRNQILSFSTKKTSLKSVPQVDKTAPTITLPIHTHARTHAHTHTHIVTCTQSHTTIYMHPFTYTHARTHTQTHVNRVALMSAMVIHFHIWIKA